MKPAKLFVGRYIMQDAVMRVYISSSIGGGEVSIGWCKGHDTYMVMTLGFDEHWAVVVQSATHETVEVAFRMAKAAFLPSFNGLLRRGSDAYRFFCTHDQFTEICDAAGDMLCYLLPDLQQAWKKMGGRL